MNTSSILMAWERAGRCQAPVKRNMDFHFKQAELRTRRAGGRDRGPDEAGPHTWQGPAWAAVQHLFTVSDSNRDPLKDKHSCVSQPGQLASGWSAVLFNDPHRGQGRGTWGDTEEIPGFVSLRESWLIQWVTYRVELSSWLLKIDYHLFRRKAVSVLGSSYSDKVYLPFAHNFCRSFLSRCLNEYIPELVPTLN